MIDFINSWVQGIVVAVIITTILEMILPNGNSKKYIRVVLGIYVLFHIITPIVNKIGGGSLEVSAKNFEDYINQNTNTNISKSLDTKNANNIKQIYVYNLKNDMKAKIRDRGFKVEKLDVKISNDEEYKIEKITLKVSKEKVKLATQNKEQGNTKVNEIEEVLINVGDTTKEKSNETRGLTTGEKNGLKQYLSSTYDIQENFILINEES